MILFNDAIEHFTRIERVLRMENGHALLVGVGGSGKQSLTRLATYAANSTLFEIQLCRGYGEREFREELKTLYLRLGIENKSTVFMFTDQHVVEEGKYLSIKYMEYFYRYFFKKFGENNIEGILFCFGISVNLPTTKFF